MKQIGAYKSKLDQIMTQAKMLDRELAEKVGCDRSAITKMRAGKLTPKLSLAVKISDATGVGIRDLIPEGEA